MIESSNKIPGANSGEGKSESPSTEVPEQQTALAAAQKRIEELEAQVKEKENKYLYLYADLENFKKRTSKERAELLKFGCESLARELLQTVDNMERALAHMPASVDSNLAEGLRMVVNQFRSTLQHHGVQSIESLQKDFDPNLHEAVGQEKSEQPSGTIVKEHMKGYTLHGRLLRPARVIVSEGQEGQAELKSG